MKIIEQPLETRYHELKVQVICKTCGAVLEAEGNDVRKYRKGSPLGYIEIYSLAVICPCCKNLTPVPKLSDSSLQNYIVSLEPTYIPDWTKQLVQNDSGKNRMVFATIVNYKVNNYSNPSQLLVVYVK